MTGQFRPLVDDDMETTNPGQNNGETQPPPPPPEPIPEGLRDFVGRNWDNFMPFERSGGGYRFNLERTAEFSNYSGDLMDPRYRAALRWYDSNQGNFVMNSRETREMIINTFSLHDTARDLEARDHVFQRLVKDNYFWGDSFQSGTLQVDSADHAVAVKLGSDKYLQFQEEMRANPLLGLAYADLLQRGAEEASQSVDSYLGYKAMQAAAESAPTALVVAQMADIKKMAQALFEETNARIARTRSLGEQMVTFSAEDAKLLALLHADLRTDTDLDAAWAAHQQRGYVDLVFENGQMRLVFDGQNGWQTTVNQATQVRDSLSDINEYWRQNMDGAMMTNLEDDSLRLRLYDYGRDARVLYGQNYGTGWHGKIAQDELAIAEIFRQKMILEFGQEQGSRRFDQLMAAPRLAFGVIGTESALEAARGYVRTYTGSDPYYAMGEHPMLLTDNYGARDFILRLTDRERALFNGVLDYWSERTDSIGDYKHPATFWNQPNFWFQNRDGRWYRCDALGVRNVTNRIHAYGAESVASIINAGRNGLDKASKQVLIEQKKFAAYSMIAGLQHAGKCLPLWMEKAGVADEQTSPEDKKKNALYVDLLAGAARLLAVVQANVSVDSKKMKDKAFWTKELGNFLGTMAGDIGSYVSDGEETWYSNPTMRNVLASHGDVTAAILFDRSKFLEALMKSSLKMTQRERIGEDARRNSDQAQRYIERTRNNPLPDDGTTGQQLNSGDGLIARYEDLIPSDEEKLLFQQYESQLERPGQRLAIYFASLSQAALAVQSIAQAYPSAGPDAAALLADQARTIRIFMTGIIKELDALRAGFLAPTPDGADPAEYNAYAATIGDLLRGILDMFASAYLGAEGQENLATRSDALRQAFSDQMVAMQVLGQLALYANNGRVAQIDGQLGNFYTDVTINDAEAGAITGTISGAVWRDANGKFHYTGAGDGVVWILGVRWTLNDFLHGRSDGRRARSPEDSFEGEDPLGYDQARIFLEIWRSANDYDNYLHSNRTSPGARETWILNGCSATANADTVRGFAAVSDLALNEITDQVRRFLWQESNPDSADALARNWARLRGGGETASLLQALAKAMGYDAAGSISEDGTVQNIIQVMGRGAAAEHASYDHMATGFWFRHVMVDERTISDEVYAEGQRAWAEYPGSPESTDRPQPSRRSRFIEVWRTEGSHLDNSLTFVQVLFDDDGNPVSAGRYNRQGQLINKEGKLIDAQGMPIYMEEIHYEMQREDGSYSVITRQGNAYAYTTLNGETVLLDQVQFNEARTANIIREQRVQRQIGAIVQLDTSGMAQLSRILDYERLQWDAPDAHDVIAGDGQLFGRGGNDLLSGGEGADQIDGGVGLDTLMGGGGDDELYGQWGQDSLDGGAGADKLFAGRDNDSLAGNDGADSLFGEQGDDLAYGGGDADRLYGGEGKDSLYGDDGDDFIFGDEDDDILFGGLGQDSLRGGSGQDRLMGGEGHDSLMGDDGHDILAGEDGDDSLDGGAGNDYLMGGAGADRILGGENDDTLIGGEGDDTLDGGRGLDHLDGGNGADLYLFDFSQEGFGQKYLYRLRPEDRVQILGAEIPQLNFEVSGEDAVLRLGDDRVLRLVGMGPAIAAFTIEIIEGGFVLRLPDQANGIAWTGSDQGDEIFGIAGNDRVLGYEGNDSLHGMAGHDVIYGGEGQDALWGGDGDDTLDGGAGADSLYGGEGLDWANYSAATAAVRVDLASATAQGAEAEGDWLDSIEGIIGSAHDDTLMGGVGQDTLIGASGHDILQSGDGDDLLQGGDGNDLLQGGAGNDWLYGDAGLNLLYGGSGQDRFVFESGLSGDNEIYDLEAGDLIILRGLETTGDNSPNDEWQDVGGETGRRPNRQPTRPPYMITYDGEDAFITAGTIGVRVVNGRSLINYRTAASFIRVE